MDEQVEKLIVVLEALESQYEQLLPVMRREKQATLSSNANAMNTVVARKQELMATMAGLERQRHGLLKEIVAQLRLPESKMKLSTLAEYVNDIQALKVKRLGPALAELIRRVQLANDENRALIKHCLGLMQSTLGFFQHWLSPASVYGNRGQINGGPVSGKLLSGIV